MCGINGKINLNNCPVSSQEIELMNEAIKHRGPDDRGVFLDGAVGLGNTRLAIIDLSPNGHMPMSTPDKSLTITYNGEIYNYQENRRLLASLGYRFKSGNDTETVLYLYQEFGLNCLHYLKGMFAFAIWDARNHTIFAARDPFGKKPLKYYLDNKVFIFSSEIKGILANKGVSKTADYQALDSFLSLRYVPYPYTGFKGVSKLPQGHYLLLKNGSLEVAAYYHSDLETKEKRPRQNWKRDLRDTLSFAVESRISASDVPVGSFLSGGFDSSVVSAIAAQKTHLKTFTVGYEGDLKENELGYAKLVANHIGADHHELIVKPSIAADLEDIVKTYEEPFADPAMLPVYYLAKATSHQTKVVLTGDGGDEVFLGYDKAEKFNRYYPYFLIPQRFREALSTWSLPKRLQFILQSLTSKPSSAFLTNFGCWDEVVANNYHYDKCFLYTDNFKKAVNLGFCRDLVAKKFTNAYCVNGREKTTFFDFDSYLPDNNLPKIDLGFMAWGLEGRSPLLDDAVVALALRMPPELRQKKRIFKETFSYLLPGEIVNRPKQGFSVPLNEWFRGGLKTVLYDSLLSSRFLEKDLFKRESVLALLKTQQLGDNNYDNHVWSLLSLATWLKVWDL